MKRIRQTDVMHPSVLIGAQCYHHRRGDKRIRVARMYTVSERRDGSGAEEYLLTRYESPDKKARSSILLVEGTGNGQTFREIHAADRKQEERMIMDWCVSKGAITRGET